MIVARRIAGIWVAGLIFLFATPGAAQQLSLSGTVRDADGVVPDAAVTLRGGASKPRPASTDSEGKYSFDGLSAGYYELSFAKAGFDTVTLNVTLGPATGAVDVTLSPGIVVSTVTVTDTAGKA